MSSHSNREEGDGAYERKQEHTSVLVPEVVALLAPKDGDVVLDATVGSGGHSEALLEAARITLVALDADPEAVAHVSHRLMPFGRRAQVIEANFADAEEALQKAGVTRIDRALFDLGWRREQLSQGKGFSFLADEPLNMSYGTMPRSGFTATDILNRFSETALADVFFGYGGERYARRIARAVVEARGKAPVETTAQFIDVVGGAVPGGYRRGRTHFATKVFQALRIAVNDELRALEQGIRGAWNLLAPGGRMAVITFHSTEDRAVKNLFKVLALEGLPAAPGSAAQAGGTLLVKKPLTAGIQERAENPSARSAKLRGIEKNLS